MTLAPVSIARGPLPPNQADLEHAQDVVILCVRARSTTLDKLNQLNYLIDKKSDYIFGPGDEQAIDKAIQGFQSDFDLIAACASAAIRSPAKAQMPSDYAAANGRSYPSGIVPDRLPVPKAGKQVSVPDFSNCKSWPECNQIALLAGLVAKQKMAGAETDAFKIIQVDPPAGTWVADGSVVTIITETQKINNPFLWKVRPSTHSMFWH